MSARGLVLYAAMVFGLTPSMAGAQAAQAGQADHADHKPASAKPTGSQTPIAPVTDADRAAAFPDVEGHAAHDRALNLFVLFDQLEWQAGEGGRLDWDNKGWLGGDLNRLWFRTEGEAGEDVVERAAAHLLYGRAISRWWDVVAGIRQDVRPGPAQTWAAIGIQGLAPYWFEIEATGYFGADGRTHARFEAEYELLLTNRLIAQPLVELELYGKSDPLLGIDAGFSTAETGVRFRYEVRRELAPYVGVTWQQKFAGTADLARSAGRQSGSTRLVVGLRTWF